MKTFKLVTPYGTYNDCYFRMYKYKIDNSLCLGIYNDEDGAIVRLTIRLDTVPNNHAYLDINNCPFAEDLVEDLEIAKPTGKWIGRGFCAYPLYKFNINKVLEYVGING